MVEHQEKNMALYCAVAWQRDFQRNFDFSSDSSSDEITARSPIEVAAVHVPVVTPRTNVTTSTRVPTWCRTSYSCPVHQSLQTSPGATNHHRNCPRAHNRQNQSSTTSPLTSPCPESNYADAATPLETDQDKSTRWVFPIICHSRVRSRTAELGYRALWSVITDFLPWIIGSYVIFQAFKYGMLELGLAAFLIMLSVHGVLKWCNARSKEKREEELADFETDAQVDSSCSSGHQHHHLHHRHQDLSDTEFSSSEDSDLEDDPPLFGKVVIVMDEPPPSYDVVSRVQDVELDLQVHLTPRHPRGEHTDKSFLSETLRVEERDELGTGAFTKSSLLPYTSCMSSEVEDDSLPSYSDAVKKIKRKKKRSQRNRVRRIENVSFPEDETLMQCVNSKDLTKMGDVTPATSNEARVSVQPHTIVSMNCNPADVTAIQACAPEEDLVNNESTVPSTVNASDTHSLLDVEATYGPVASEQEPNV